MISPTQMRAARAMLSLSQGDVAKSLGIAANTLSNIESGQSDAPASRLKEIQEYYEREGLEFIEGDGVRKKQATVVRLSGQDGLITLMNDIYDFATIQGGEICLFNAKPENWFKWLDVDWYKERAERLLQYADNFEMKSTVIEGNTHFLGSSYQRYRWFPRDLFISNDESLYSYGDKLAFITFREHDVEVLIFQSKQFADGVKALFNIAWDNVAKIPTCGERGELKGRK